MRHTCPAGDLPKTNRSGAFRQHQLYAGIDQSFPQGPFNIHRQCLPDIHRQRLRSLRKAVWGYEARGLLPAAERTEAGYRPHDQHDIELLTFIRRARALGPHMDDIRDVLAIRNGGTPPFATVRCLLDARIAEIGTTVIELLALCKTLAETRQRADDCTDDQPVTVCGIIEDSQPTSRRDTSRSTHCPFDAYLGTGAYRIRCELAASCAALVKQAL
ncbi:MerR family DNA-binding protein [Streptomyces sp. NPDC020298]|uniref:MerR family DNA-binding protein n=1 Tax=unclassified Streptomyces TaxID=2593676 RepID=UPI0034008232